MQISLEEARSRIVSAQGFNAQNSGFGHGKRGALAALEHLSYIQIDTISVIERAHHHVFQSRVPDYQPEHLHEMVTVDKTAFEYWSHAAAFLPMRDYRFSLPRKKRYADGLSHWFEPTREHKKQRRIILDRIRSEGPLQCKDFERPSDAKSGWFERTPAKQMLEQLFIEGELMIRERKGFQKVYDLTERVLPASVNTDFPSEEEMAMYLVRSCLRSQAIATEAEIAYLRSAELKGSVSASLKKMVASGEVLSFCVEGLKKTYFALAIEFQRATPSSDLGEVKILSPFDSFVIQRKRLLDFFDFPFQVEIYVPKPKRKYGYFALPLLYGNQMVGLLDLKAHRAQKKLEVAGCFLRAQFKQDKEFLDKLKSSLKDFALFNGCQKAAFSRRPLLYQA